MPNDMIIDIRNGILKVTHPTGVISEYAVPDYDKLIELTQGNLDIFNKELIVLQSVRQELVNSKRV